MQRIGEEQYDTVVACVNASLALHPVNNRTLVRAINLVGEISVRENNWGRARAAFLQLYSLSDQNHMALFFAAMSRLIELNLVTILCKNCTMAISNFIPLIKTFEEKDSYYQKGPPFVHRLEVIESIKMLMKAFHLANRTHDSLLSQLGSVKQLSEDDIARQRQAHEQMQVGGRRVPVHTEPGGATTALEDLRVHKPFVPPPYKIAIGVALTIIHANADIRGTPTPPDHFIALAIGSDWLVPPHTYYNLGWIWHKDMLLEPAQQAFGASVAVDPLFLPGWQKLAELYADAFDVRKAVFCLRKAAQLGDGEAEPLIPTLVKEICAGLTSGSCPTEDEVESWKSDLADPARFITLDAHTENPHQLYYKIQGQYLDEEVDYLREYLKESGYKEADTTSSLWHFHHIYSLPKEYWLAILPVQKTNRFPYLKEFNEKDALCKNMRAFRSRFGDDGYVHPECWVLPEDYAEFAAHYHQHNTTKLFMLKKAKSARGEGISMITDLAEVPKAGDSYAVHRYIDNPLLLDGVKFGLRVYIVVTSFNPLRVYLFDDGLTSLSAEKYSTDRATLKNKFIHVTNTDIQVNHPNYVFDEADKEDSEFQSHRWTNNGLRKKLLARGVDWDGPHGIWSRIKDLVIKTMLSAEQRINEMVEGYLAYSGVCHEVMALDLLLDDTLKPWLLEVNLGPSMKMTSPQYSRLKQRLIRNVLRLNQVVPYSAARWDQQEEALLRERLHLGPSSTCTERIAHGSIDRVLRLPMECLGRQDLITLAEMEAEYDRRGDFERIFPASNSEQYEFFFEAHHQRYHNALVRRWLALRPATLDTNTTRASPVPRPPHSPFLFAPHNHGDAHAVGPQPSPHFPDMRLSYSGVYTVQSQPQPRHHVVPQRTFAAHHASSSSGSPDDAEHNELPDEL